MEKFQSNLEKRGYGAAAKSIDYFLKGDSGTGFVYVTDNGENYILTNYHVISQAYSLSVTFENINGEKTKFSDLSIIAADENMDIALLAFAGGQNPFQQGLVFLDNPVQEGDDVYSAGFPGLGTAMIWQLGRGMVSNAFVRLPDADDSGKMLGPYIQHTAQVDPGNSGGPLLVQSQGVPTGFAVVGINTLSARYRQAANYSIPLNQIRSFLDASLTAKTGTDLTALNERIDSFIEGLIVEKAVYHHIAAYLSNTCTAENAEYALSEMIEKAPKTIQDDIVQAFVYSPVDGMSYAVAWTIENTMRSKAGKISVTKDSVAVIDDNNYTVSFRVNDSTIKSEWTNEYGIWQIRAFGDFAAGDKSLIRRKAEKREADSRLRANPDFQISAGLANIFDRGPVFGADMIIRYDFISSGLRTFFAKNFFQIEGSSGLYIPIKAQKIAFTPFGNFGVGFQFLKNSVHKRDNDSSMLVSFLVSLSGGLQLTTAAVPGLFFQLMYQYNFIPDIFEKRKDYDVPPDKHILFFSVGYSF